MFRCFTQVCIVCICQVEGHRLKNTCSCCTPRLRAPWHIKVWSWPPSPCRILQHFPTSAKLRARGELGPCWACASWSWSRSRAPQELAPVWWEQGAFASQRPCANGNDVSLLEHFCEVWLFMQTLSFSDNKALKLPSNVGYLETTRRQYFHL